MSLLAIMEENIRNKGGLIVSCQPVENSPLDKPKIIAAMAQAAVNAGAIAVRIEGIDNLKVARPLIDVPIIGIIKRDLPDSPVRITPFMTDVDDLINNGADIIAFDGTDRTRATTVLSILDKIHAMQKLAMADCSDLSDGINCWHLGADFIGTTLSGYTIDTTPSDPDFGLVKNLADKGCRVIAEGRYNTPEQALKAMQLGAWSVTVGSAITRLEHVCSWFNQALLQKIKD